MPPKRGKCMNKHKLEQKTNTHFKWTDKHNCSKVLLITINRENPHIDLKRSISPPLLSSSATAFGHTPSVWTYLMEVP